MEASQVDIVYQNSDKMTSEDVKSLIVFYRSNPVLCNASYPQYRNHVAKNKLKEDHVNTLGNRYGIEVLEKKFHSLRTSMRREVKRKIEKDNSVNKGNEPVGKRGKKLWLHYEDMIFMKEEIERGKFIESMTGVPSCLSMKCYYLDWRRNFTRIFIFLYAHLTFI